MSHHWHHDADSVINGTTVFLRSGQPKWGAKWPFWWCDTTGDSVSIINGITTFLRSRQSKWALIWLFWSVMPLALHDIVRTVICTTEFTGSSKNQMRCNMTFWSGDTIGIDIGIMMPTAFSMASLHSLVQDGQNEVQHDFLGLLQHWHQDWHHMILTALSKEPLHFSCQGNWNEAQWLFWPCDANGISVSITWCQWHQKWHYCIFSSTWSTWPFLSCSAIRTHIVIKKCW